MGLLAVLAYLMACAGFAEVMMFGPDAAAHTWWDVGSASLQLFVFETSDATAHWPLHLQIARALAPMVVLYTAASAVWKVVNQEVALYGLLFRKRRFIVVCGIGETGYRIARDYCLNSDKRVIVIDSNPHNALAAELENYGAIVIYGNAMDPLVLMKAQVVFAKELFLCTSDDKANIAIAKNADRLTRRLRPRDIERMRQIAKRHELPIAGETPHLGLRCFLCVDTPDIYEVFAAHSFFETNTERFAIRLFNRRETIARNIFRNCAPDLYYRPASTDDRRIHILFIGFEALVREMILQTALTAHYTDFRLPLVTVLCPPDTEPRIGRFLHRYPHLLQTVEIRFFHDDPMTVSEEKWREMQAQVPFSVCYVGMQQDVEGILSARRLNRLRRLGGMAPLNFVVCLNQQNYLAEIIDDDFLPIALDKSLLPEHEPIEYFETLDETISIDVVVNEALDVLARTLHNAYLRSQTNQGVDAAQNASVISWSDLPAHKKKANQHAAAHVDVKLRICGCIAYGAEAAPAAVRFPPDAETLEALAQLEHRRWMADKYLAGYSFGPRRDEDRMLHPDLIPWEQLTDTDKEKDRENIRQIPKLLQLQNQKICRQGL
ncbi:MAG: NAD-binding protein [Haliea sp.]